MKRACAPLMLLLSVGTACAEPALRPHAASVSASTSQTQTGLASARMFGRFDVQDPAGPRFAWPATGVVVRFRGSQLDVRMKDPAGQNVFQIVVDGNPAGTLTTQAGKDRYTVIKGLTDGEHELVLFKRTEARSGEVQMLGFALPDGSPLLPPPASPTRRLEVIGDSITAGYGNEGTNEHCRNTPDMQNAYMTYAAQSARALGADLSTLAWSGKTVVGMNEIYDRALPARADSRWDPQAWVPDAIVINLGTNDISRGDQHAEFVNAYIRFIDRLRALYPKALIVCVVGPMLTDSYPPGKQSLTRARAYVHQVVDAKKSDGHVVFLEFPMQEASGGYGCDYHPNLKTHKDMSERLTALLKKELAW